MTQVKTSAITRLIVLLVKPSKYDRDGYLLRFMKGVLPSNSFAAMYSLTKSAFSSPALAGLACEIHAFDEVVWRQKFDAKKEIKKYLNGNTKVVVAFIGVQTNQFPRACDIASLCKEAGAEVVIGGFHVSGSISTMLDGIAVSDARRSDVPSPHIMPPEIDSLMKNGIIIFHGESEGMWKDVLRDIVMGKQKLLYRGGLPDLTSAPIPEFPPRYLEDFAGCMETLDTGRGCPFACSFCTIINVQGRSSRFRNPKEVVAKVKKICGQKKIASFFFTDDNFARNPHWEEILDGLIELKKSGHNFTFMVEIDLASHKIPKFIEKLGRAGCWQVFIGMETVNQESLKKAQKGQNKVSDYQMFCDMLHENGMIVQAGYIIGFENDTKDSILRDVATIQSIGVDKVAFFILTPLPGSEDHIKMHCGKIPMDPDFNLYDSFQPVCEHPQMSRAELLEAYEKSWKEFYRSHYMIRSLERCPKHYYWWLFKMYVWYRNSALGEKTHPMMCGFMKLRSRVRDRRPGYAIDSIPVHIAKEFWRYMQYFGHIFREFYIFQHVYFQSQLKPEIASRLSQDVRGVKDWFARTFKLPATRVWLNAFWIKYGRQKWNLFWKWHLHGKMLPYAFTEIVYTIRFWMALNRNAKTMMKG